jgi:hypothetical protein
MFQRALLSAVFTVGAHRCAAQCVDDHDGAMAAKNSLFTCDMAKSSISTDCSGCMGNIDSLCEEDVDTAYGVAAGTKLKDQCPETCNMPDSYCVTAACNTHECAVGYTLKSSPADISGASDSVCCDGATAASPSVSLFLRNRLTSLAAMGSHLWVFYMPDWIQTQKQPSRHPQQPKC